MCALYSTLPIQRGSTAISRQNLLIPATDIVTIKNIKLSAAEYRRKSLRLRHEPARFTFFGYKQRLKGLSESRLLVSASSDVPKQPSDNQSQNLPFRSRGDGEGSQSGKDVGDSGLAFNIQDSSEKELPDRANKTGWDFNAGTTFKETKRMPEQSTLISDNAATYDGRKYGAGQDPLEVDGNTVHARVADRGNGLAGSRVVGPEARSSDSLEEEDRAAQTTLGKQDEGVETKGRAGMEYTAVDDDTKISAAIAGAVGLIWERLRNNPAVHFMAQWPAWQQKKRLERIQGIADANPKDASKQAALLSELYKTSPQAVIERFERREHATDGQTVVEYLRALVATNSIMDYLPDERTGRSSGLPALLQELKQRASGDSEEGFAPPGMTEQQPLHVVMVDPKSSSKSMRFMQELVSTILFMIVFSIIWVMGAAALRKYVNGIAGMGSSSSMSPSNVYAPKEFNKEAVPEKNVKTFKDVKGCDEAKAELEEIVEYLKNPSKFTRLGGKLPKGVLLIGPPGTGKTLLAKAIAGEAGVPFYYRAGSEFEEMFVGVGARRVRSLFQAAKKKAPCIVFIDEIDAVGGSRKQWEGHTKKTLNQLLVEMDGFEANEGIIVLAATNLPETLDPALTRPGRFDRHVVVTNPDVRGRQEILELYLQDKPLSEDIDINLLARGTPGFSGADLANLVNMAAVKAAVDGIDKICTDQLEFAKDKILMGTERKSLSLSEESRKLTAYHESGHAVVAFNTAGANPIHKATITPRGTALGMVTQLPDKDETSVSKKQMLARLDVCMGGRVAEEMIFGSEQVTSGARSDLQQATALARHMVSECGMSDTVGPIFIDTESQRQSHEIQKSIDAEVVRLLKEAYERVKKLLKKHEADLHALARALLETETLNSQEIKAILSPFKSLEQVEEEAISATVDS